MNLRGERYQSRHKSRLRFLPSPFRKHESLLFCRAEVSFLLLSELPTVEASEEKKHEREGKEVKPVQSVTKNSGKLQKPIHLLNGATKKGISVALTQQPSLWEV